MPRILLVRQAVRQAIIRNARRNPRITCPDDEIDKIKPGLAAALTLPCPTACRVKSK